MLQRICRDFKKCVNIEFCEKNKTLFYFVLSIIVSLKASLVLLKFFSVLIGTLNLVG